ncbi:hypothetical protein BHE74_00013414 [Ensete ventricosum]|nr:hypothetical protein BHE74_00013414 [Ensete ventricosum]
MSLLWVAGFLFVWVRWAHGTEYWNTSEVASVNNGGGGNSPPLLVGLTLIQSAAATHAVLLPTERGRQYSDSTFSVEHGI